MADLPAGAHDDDTTSAVPDVVWRQDDLTPAEVLWVGTLLTRLRERRGFSLGIFADSIVATALPGAVLSPGGTDRYDLLWNGIKIEVKSSSKGKWTIKPAFGRESDGTRVCRLWADVYVLAVHDGNDHRTGWSFYVVGRALLNPTAATPIRHADLDGWATGPIDADGLPDAVLAALDAD